ncbi:MAG: hypothetical protein IH934_00500 [Nanoarchaeota archaeon]|nr:hypothetical protein [Nanoarchaeota archaeon]
MAADPFNYTQNRYDAIIQEIIRELDLLLSRLLSDKDKQKELRNTIVHKLHADQKEIIENKRAELEDKKASNNLTNEQLQKITEIDSLRTKLDELIEQDINIERRKAILIKDDPARIDEEIRILNELRRDVQEKAGNKRKRRNLTRDDATEMYNKLIKVHKSILIRKEESDLTKQKFKPVQDEIERQSNEIINMIDKLLESIPPEEPPGTAPTVPPGGPTPPSPEEIMDAEKLVKGAERFVKKQFNWFLRAYDILNDLRDVAKSNISPKRKLRDAQKLLRKLERIESREQWTASVEKLKDKLMKVIDLRTTRPDIKEKIRKIIPSLKVWEAEWLVTTVEELGKLLKKGKKEVKWEEVIKYVDIILKDTRAVVADDKEVDNLLKETYKLLDEEEEKQKKAAELNAGRVRALDALKKANEVKAAQERAEMYQRHARDVQEAPLKSTPEVEARRRKRAIDNRKQQGLRPTEGRKSARVRYRPEMNRIARQQADKASALRYLEQEYDKVIATAKARERAALEKQKAWDMRELSMEEGLLSYPPRGTVPGRQQRFPQPAETGVPGVLEEKEARGERIIDTELRGEPETPDRRRGGHRRTGQRNTRRSIRTGRQINRPRKNKWTRI